MSQYHALACHHATHATHSEPSHNHALACHLTPPSIPSQVVRSSNRTYLRKTTVDPFEIMHDSIVHVPLPSTTLSLERVKEGTARSVHVSAPTHRHNQKVAARENAIIH